MCRWRHKIRKTADEILQSVNNRTQCLRESAYYAWLLLTYIVINTILGRMTPDILPVCIVLDGTMLLFLVLSSVSDLLERILTVRLCIAYRSFVLWVCESFEMKRRRKLTDRLLSLMETWHAHCIASLVVVTVAECSYRGNCVTNTSMLARLFIRWRMPQRVFASLLSCFPLYIYKM